MYSSSSTLLDTRLSAVIRLDFRGFLFESQFEVSGTFSDENKRMSFFLKHNVNLSFSSEGALLWFYRNATYRRFVHFVGEVANYIFVVSRILAG